MEILEDALDFFLTAANPHDDFAAICHAAIAVSVSNDGWAERVERANVDSGDFDEPLEDFAEYM